MDWLVLAIVAVVIIGFAIVGQKKGWIDLTTSRAKRRGGGGAGWGGVDEIFQPTRYETQIELDRQSRAAGARAGSRATATRTSTRATSRSTSPKD